jgi:hypothetical protein
VIELQPKSPLAQVRAESALLQVLSPAPENEAVNRLDDEAVVEKRLVVVAEVEVEFTAVKFWRVVEPTTRRSPDELMVVVAVCPILKELAVKALAKSEVVVAEVVVERVMLLKM